MQESCNNDLMSSDLSLWIVPFGGGCLLDYKLRSVLFQSRIECLRVKLDNDTDQDLSLTTTLREGVKKKQKKKL